MRYFSTNRSSVAAGFREAVLAGQPADKGLYFPDDTAELPAGFADRLRDLSNSEIAFEVIRPFVGGEIDDASLVRICSETVELDIPLVPVADSVFALELFHGPTLAFKDIGARFMSRVLGYFSNASDKKTVVLVATSGDTGGAVAAGFQGVDGVDVVIVYPKGKVSRIQELQLTTSGGNVTALELDGTFDDCQAIVKQALADDDITSRARLTSANSINVARWLPQQFYYFFALKQWNGPPPVISVPSGNFGNLAAGMLARSRGLPVKHFIAACNANDVVPRFLQTDRYEPAASIATLSNAMDVGSPSNFVRIMELFAGDIERLKLALTAQSIDDAVTAETMQQVHRETGYVLDPHGAVGYRCLAEHIAQHPGEKGIFLETAHPVKFDSVSEIIGQPVELPASVQHLLAKSKQSVEVDNDYAQAKEILLSRI